MKNPILVAACLLSAAAAFADPPAAARPADFGERVSVSITSIRARFLDERGNPLRGLRPEDLDLRVGGQTIPVAALDWVTDPVRPDDHGTPPPPRPAAHVQYTRHRVSTFGQLFVFYVQTAPGRAISARARAAAMGDLRRLLGRLKPEDLAAVVSYDGRLALELDFTRDREAAARALERATRAGEPPKVELAAGSVTLAPLARGEGQEISPELALERTARALAPLPGEKVTIYLGLERHPFAEVETQAPAAGGSSRMTFSSASRKQYLVQTPAMIRAILALQEASATVFVLDDTRSLDAYRGNLQVLALLTGGTYARLREKQVESLGRTFEGYYVITLDPSALPRLEKKERVELRVKGKNAMVLATPLWVVTE